MNCSAIIPARGGSKGIPRKNLIEFCGYPLLAWTIAAVRRCAGVARVYVSTDCEEIAETSRKYGAGVILRPEDISGDMATSESALLHACDCMGEETGSVPDVVMMLQATSPLRETAELDGALRKFSEDCCDALFSAASPDDFLIWKGSGENLQSVNYDWRNRVRRQDADGADAIWIETGSFYLTRYSLLKETGNRMGGRIGLWPVPLWKSYEIDSLEGLEFCELLMRHHGLDKHPPEMVSA